MLKRTSSGNVPHRRYVIDENPNEVKHDVSYTKFVGGVPSHMLNW